MTIRRQLTIGAILGLVFGIVDLIAIASIRRPGRVANAVVG